MGVRHTERGLIHNLEPGEASVGGRCDGLRV